MKTEISRHATFAEANAALIEARGMETAAREDYLVTNGNLNDYEEKNYNIEMVNDEFIVCEFTEGEIIKQYMSEIGKRGGKKGGSSRTPKKSASSAANLDRARAEGKTGGYPAGRKRGFFMNPATGSVDDYDGWWYETEGGEKVNAVDRGEVVRVVKDKDGNWIEK